VWLILVAMRSARTWIILPPADWSRAVQRYLKYFICLRDSMPPSGGVSILGDGIGLIEAENIVGELFGGLKSGLWDQKFALLGPAAGTIATSAAFGVF
jgi:hypothetical protein